MFEGKVFQSTPSLRKATVFIAFFCFFICISIHTFLAEGDGQPGRTRSSMGISIHTFLAEGDQQTGRDLCGQCHFNPHLPCGRRRCTGVYTKCKECNFNPHLPCGRRRPEKPVLQPSHLFQSTPSLRKATIAELPLRNTRNISIHTFLAEGDHNWINCQRYYIISIHTFLAEGDI